MDYDPKIDTAARPAAFQPIRAELASQRSRVRAGIPARQDQQYRLLPVWQISAERPAAAVKDEVGHLPGGAED